MPADSIPGPTEATPTPALDYVETLRLKALIVEHARTEPLTAAWLEALAEREGVSVAHAYVALAQDRSLRLEREHPLVLGVCVGDCDRSGAVGLLHVAIEQRAERARANAPGFDILPRVCFDKCMHAPFCASRRDDGRELLYSRLSPSQLVDAIDEALGE